MNVKAGTYTGNGADNRNISGVGFQPDFVLVKGGSSSAFFSSASSPADKSKGAVSASTMNANQIQAFQSDGFQLGSDSAVNTTSTVYYYIAIKCDSADSKIGSYTGSGSDNNNVTGVGFTPTFVMVWSDSNNQPWWRTSLMGSGGDSSCRFDSDLRTDNIQALQSDGFQLGTSSEVNGSGRTCYYLAVKDASAVFGVFTYTGNGSDNRSISGIGFQPDFVLVQNTDTNGTPSVIRFTDETGDNSFEVAAVGEATNKIQAFETDGFQVGNNNSANQNTIKYHGFALKNAAPAAATTTQRRTLSALGTRSGSRQVRAA
jgi:hypothetical protein